MTALYPSHSTSGPALSQEDQRLVWAVATLMLEVADPYGDALADFLVHRKLRDLPKDGDMIRGIAVHAAADAREVLVTLRAGMSPSGHEPPVEAIEHARYLRSRGVGLTSLISMYKYGFALLRDLIGLELEARTSDSAQLSRLLAACDAYTFPFLTMLLGRLAYEYGAYNEEWTPRPDDPVLVDRDTYDEAKQLRDGRISIGRWLAATPQESSARSQAEQAMGEFAETLCNGASDKGLHDRLALASTRVALTLADEPDVSMTLLLDRSPVEVIEGVGDVESQLWIPSVDLARLWSAEYYLPMAIAKGRVRVTGPARKFLRVLPILRTIGEAPSANGIPEVTR